MATWRCTLLTAFQKQSNKKGKTETNPSQSALKNNSAQSVKTRASQENNSYLIVPGFQRCSRFRLWLLQLDRRCSRFLLCILLIESLQLQGQPLGNLGAETGSTLHNRQLELIKFWVKYSGHFGTIWRNQKQIGQKPNLANSEKALDRGAEEWGCAAHRK
jgi:hypothetical protein